MLDLSERNSGSGYISSEDQESQIFSLRILEVMDLIQQDIFGSAREIKEAEGVNTRLIKESSGDKSYNKLELVAIILFKPYLALCATDDPNKNASSSSLL